MAGEIFIADKATLDSVKNDVSVIKRSTPVFDSTIVGRYGGVSTTITAGASLYALTELKRSGYLYAVLATCADSNKSQAGQLQVLIDGKMIVNYDCRSNKTNANNLLCGIANKSVIWQMPDDTVVFPGGSSINNYNFVNGSGYFSENSQQASVTIIPEPIRFSTSLKIMGSAAGGNISVYWIYMLD